MARHPALEQRIGHRFTDPSLLAQALTHRSFGSPHNERLEFLGDGVLACVIADELYARFPDVPEGTLHLMKTSLVRGEALAEVARNVGLSEFLRLGGGESSSGGSERPSILTDTLEAVYGAVFLDGGYEAAQRVVRKTFGAMLQELNPSRSVKDAKTRLNEYMHAKRHSNPEYRILAASESAQNPHFEVECIASELGVAARGSGSSRQRAEQQAAANLLKQIGG